LLIGFISISDNHALEGQIVFISSRKYYIINVIAYEDRLNLSSM